MIKKSILTVIIPWPLSKNSVMKSALHGDQGSVLLRWIKKGAIIWCPLRCPNNFSQVLESSCGMLSTWPEKQERRAERCTVSVQCNNFSTLLYSCMWQRELYIFHTDFFHCCSLCFLPFQRMSLTTKHSNRLFFNSLKRMWLFENIWNTRYCPVYLAQTDSSMILHFLIRWLLKPLYRM